MKQEINSYYRTDGTFISGYFRAGKPDLLPPDEFVADHYPKQEEEFLQNGRGEE